MATVMWPVSFQANAAPGADSNSSTTRRLRTRLPTVPTGPTVNWDGVRSLSRIVTSARDQRPFLEFDLILRKEKKRWDHHLPPLIRCRTCRKCLAPCQAKTYN